MRKNIFGAKRRSWVITTKLKAIKLAEKATKEENGCIMRTRFDMIGTPSAIIAGKHKLKDTTCVLFGVATRHRFVTWRDTRNRGVMLITVAVTLVTWPVSGYACNTFVHA